MQDVTLQYWIQTMHCTTRYYKMTDKALTDKLYLAICGVA